MKKLGMALSKSTLFSEHSLSSQLGHLDGPTMATQELRVLTIVQSVLQTASAASLLTCITRLACMLASTSQELMLRLCQASGSTKLDLAAESTLETTCGYLATCSHVLLKTTMSMFPSHQSFSVTGMVQGVTQTSPPRPCVKALGE